MASTPMRDIDPTNYSTFSSDEDSDGRDGHKDPPKRPQVIVTAPTPEVPAELAAADAQRRRQERIDEIASGDTPILFDDDHRRSFKQIIVSSLVMWTSVCGMIAINSWACLALLPVVLVSCLFILVGFFRHLRPRPVFMNNLHLRQYITGRSSGRSRQGWIRLYLLFLTWGTLLFVGGLVGTYVAGHNYGDGSWFPDLNDLAAPKVALWIWFFVFLVLGAMAEVAVLIVAPIVVLALRWHAAINPVVFPRTTSPKIPRYPGLTATAIRIIIGSHAFAFWLASTKFITGTFEWILVAAFFPMVSIMMILTVKHILLTQKLQLCIDWQKEIDCEPVDERLSTLLAAREAADGWLTTFTLSGWVLFVAVHLCIPDFSKSQHWSTGGIVVMVLVTIAYWGTVYLAFKHKPADEPLNVEDM